LYLYLGHAISKLRHFSATERYRNHDRPFFNDVFELATKLSDVGNTVANQNDDLNPDSDKRVLQTPRNKEPVGFAFKNQGGLTRPVTKIHNYGYVIFEILHDHFLQKTINADTLDLSFKSVSESKKLHQLWTDIVKYSRPGTSEKASKYSETYILKKVLHSRCATYIKKRLRRAA
jgi:hypothetical protein